MATYRLALFGRDLGLTPGTPTIERNWGGLSNQVGLQVRQVSPALAQVQVTVSGAFPFAPSLTIGVTFDAAIEGQRLVLRAATVVAAGSQATLLKPEVADPLSTNPADQVSFVLKQLADFVPSRAFGFVIRAGAATGLTNHILNYDNLGQLLEVLSPNPQQREPWFAFDAPSGSGPAAALYGLEGKVDLRVNDHVSAKARQVLSIDHLRKWSPPGEATRWSLRLKPDKGYLLIGSDRLAKTGLTASPVLYQFGLVNGVLALDKQGQVGALQSRQSWLPDGANEAAVLAMRLTDEQGLPVALCADEPFRIRMRKGATGRRVDSLVLTTPREGAPLKVRVRSVDVSALDEDRLLGLKADAPAWMTDRGTPLASAPLELHGLARGMRLARAGGDGGPWWSAQLESTVAWRSDRAAEPAFELAELALEDAGGWRVAMQMPEEGVYPGATQLLQAEVMERKASIRKGSVLRIPLMDVSWGMANMLRADATGAQPEIPSSTVGQMLRRLQLLDRQFNDPDPALRVVAPPHLGDGDDVAFTQNGGARGRPRGRPDFDEVFAGIGLSAATAVETTLPLPQLNTVSLATALLAAPRQAALARALAPAMRQAGETPSLEYLHGGEGDDGAPGRVAAAMDAGAPFGDQYSFFAQAWLAPTPAQDAFFKRLRTALNLDFFDLTKIAAGMIPDEALDQASELAETVLSGAFRNALAPVADLGKIETLAAWLEAAPPEEILDEIVAYFDRPGDFDPELGFIARWFLSPPDHDLFRRMAGLFTPANAKWLGENFGGELDQLAQALFGKLPILSPAPLEGFLTELMEGASTEFMILAELWKSEGQAGVEKLLEKLGLSNEEVQIGRLVSLFTDLRSRLGPILTKDVYARLLALRDDASAVVDVLRDELKRKIARLADISTEPPDYFVLSHRLGVMPPGRGASLWSHAFDFCRQGSTPWFFNLDSDTTVVVKVGTRQSMAQVLKELHGAYSQPDRPNPLCVPDGDLDDYITRIATDVRDEPAWVGVFIIRPTVDLGQDVMVKSLTGLGSIEALYVALGGAKPKGSGDTAPKLNVIARIRKIAAAPPVGEKQELRDADFTLVKFDVTVRNTGVEEGEIACRLNLVELFGQTKVTTKTMLIQAVLPREKLGDTARTFEFGCIFDQPLVVDVNILCLESVAFKSLKAIPHGGGAAIEIDANVTLRSGDLPIDLGDNPVVGLQGFRIRLPDMGPAGIRMGSARTVAFDFPAISIRLPSPRTLNLSGLDIVPTGLGFLRLKEGEASSALKDLKARFRSVPIPGFDFDLGKLEPGNFSLPTIELTLDLGKLPGLGGGGAFRLDVVLGVPVVGGIPDSRLFLGIGGFEADNLKIDLFRIITLEIKKLLFSNAYKAGRTKASAKAIGLLLAEQIRLKILDWSPLDDKDDLSFAYMNYASPKGGEDKSWLVSLQNRSPSNRFLKVYGVALGKGLNFDDKIYNMLLGQMDSAQSVLPSFIDTPNQWVKADVSGDYPWLLAITFGLKGILDRCALVLQDGRYYGIRISADWVKAVFDLEALSLAYIPGPTRTQDRFRVVLTIPKLDMIANMRSGEIALEWGVNQDFLIDVGFPWLDSQGYNWFRAFSVPAGTYEIKFGFYIEKRTHVEAQGELITFGAGFAIYGGYFFGAGNSVAWVRAGVGVFAVLQARLTVNMSAKISSVSDLPNLIESVEITGAVGIFAYGEGGIDVWVLSARFRVSAQASVTVTILVARGQPTALSYAVVLAVGYSASVKIGSGWFSWTFRVSGTLGVPVSGRLMLG